MTRLIHWFAGFHMRTYFSLTLFFAIYVLGTLMPAFSQAIPNVPNDDLRRQMEANARSEADLERRMQEMHQLEGKMKAMNKWDSRVSNGSPTLDRNTQERVRAMRRIDPKDIVQYVDFLGAERTGVFRLFPDFNCVTTNVIRIDGDCANFVPVSSSFSFRKGGYVDDESYHDIGLEGNQIVSRAFFSEGILVSLGDIPIEEATLANAGLRFLVNFSPDVNATAARETAARIANGIDSDGYKYSGSVEATQNSTYALRIIAYKVANSLPPIREDTTMSQLRFLSLAFDKRADLIVVFRIVKKGADGNITIVWKELDRKEAPKIRFAKGEKLADFRS